MTQPSEIDYESKQKYFAHLPASIVKATFKHTTKNMRFGLIFGKKLPFHCIGAR
jgi:hypothetical protein